MEAIEKLRTLLNTLTRKAFDTGWTTGRGRRLEVDEIARLSPERDRDSGVNDEKGKIVAYVAEMLGDYTREVERLRRAATKAEDEARSNATEADTLRRALLKAQGSHCSGCDAPGCKGIE